MNDTKIILTRCQISNSISAEASPQTQQLVARNTQLVAGNKHHVARSKLLVTRNKLRVTRICCAQQASSCAQLVARSLLRWCKRGIRLIAETNARSVGDSHPSCLIHY